MLTNDDWNALSKAVWNQEAGAVRLNAKLLQRLMSGYTELDRKVRELELDVIAAIDANPFAKVKPSEHAAVEDDMVNRLRGIYRTVLPAKDSDLFDGKGVLESRYAVGELSHNAADRIEALMAEVANLKAAGS